MYTKDQAEIALKEFEQTDSIAAVIQKLGYPTSSTLYRWYEDKKSGICNRHGTMDYNSTSRKRYENQREHPRIPSVEEKINAIHRCFEEGRVYNMYQEK